MSQKDSQAGGLLRSILGPSPGCHGLVQATPEYAQTQDAFEKGCSGVKGN